MDNDNDNTETTATATTIPSIEDGVDYFPLFNALIHNKDKAIAEIATVPTRLLPYGIESLTAMLFYLDNAREIVAEILMAYGVEAENRRNDGNP